MATSRRAGMAMPPASQVAYLQKWEKQTGR